MTSVAIQTIKQFRLGTDFLHFDTTSLSFFGAMEDEEFGSMSDSIVPTPPAITFGYSKDHRPDLKQVMYGTLLTRDGGVPLFGQALDGNAGDNHSAAAFFQRIRSLVEDPRSVCCVADSKGWCSEVLDLVQKEKLRLLSRLPRTNKLHRAIMAKPWAKPRVIERARKRKDAEPEHCHILGYDVDEVLDIERPHPDPSLPVLKEKLRVPARAVRVFSSALLKQKQKTLGRTRLREAARAKKLLRRWHAQAYACETDAQRAADRHTSQAGFITIDVRATLQPVDGPMQRRRGRPPRNPEPELTDSHYRVSYEVVPVTDTVTTMRLRDQATFILIRTRPSNWTIDDAELIERYKGQYLNEHGFAWLKSGPGHKGINPIFLASPKRISSLCFLYVIGLLVWTLVQRTVRLNLKKTGEGLPYRRNKPSSNITTRFLFELFTKIQTVPCTLIDGTHENRLVGMTDVTKLACKALETSLNAFSPVVINQGK
jgi:transposase